MRRSGATAAAVLFASAMIAAKRPLAPSLIKDGRIADAQEPLR